MTARPGMPRVVFVAAGFAALIVVGAAAFWLGSTTSARSTATGSGAAKGAPLYWYDPMVPDQHFDKPGKSPFMDMQLVPRYPGDAPDAPAVHIDPGVAQNLGVRLATVEQADVRDKAVVSGVLSFNQRDEAIVEAKAAGLVERARRLAVGDVVAAGDPLVDLRIPEWTSAVADYLLLRTNHAPDLETAARKRLAMLGVPEGEISAAEKSGEPPRIFTLRAPIGGAVTALSVRDGMNIAAGAPIATLNGLSPVWLVASAPQGVAGRLQPGGKAVATLPAYPGEQFSGVIESVLPQASMASRTVEVRVALPNPGGRLRPGMTAEVDLSSGDGRNALLAPTEAVIRTGRRSVVIVADKEGGFTPVEVETGDSHGERIEIVHGLAAGQKVVASGQFLIDSEANLTGVLARMSAGAKGAAAPSDYQSVGRVTAVNATGVTISHQPVPALSWPAMTMTFAWGGGGPKDEVKVGDEVAFSFREGAAGYAIETIKPAGARP
ncbi:MAG: efflux RND transporter periplasmic adaptor subunit [Alphaproteobacteria bacterium]|nr:efflux RND transporter periplasmic adaptor subunit [Alphaproteobacteria bacterium]